VVSVGIESSGDTDTTTVIAQTNGNMSQKAEVGQTLVLLSTFVYQCSSQYSTQVCCLTSPNSGVYSIYTENGDICIVRSIVSPVPLPDFDSIVVLSGDGEDQDNPTLQNLTKELQAITEKGTGCTFENFEIQWGLRAGELPFMLEGPECDVPPLVALELLCLALEVVVQPQPGRCITPERVCVGCDHSIQRKKVAIFRIRKFFDKYLGTDELDQTIERITSKFNALYPESTLRNVACCPYCFKLYSTTSSRSLSSAPLPPPRNRRAVSASLKEKDFPTRMRRFVAFQKMPSGLTIVQDISAGSHRKAHCLYLSDPFPAFLQHPRPK
jgi:hypothetical protein